MKNFLNYGYLTAEEFLSMSDGEIEENFPTDFIKSPYNYCGRFGEVQFVPLNTIYIEIYSITLKLKNEKIFPFSGYKIHHKPSRGDLN